MVKKKGSILIETIVGVNIILIMFLIVASLINHNQKSLLKRIEIENANRVVYCIMQEIKYNTTIDEILNGKSTNEITFDMYDDFLVDLSNQNLSYMDKGDDILVIAKETDDEDKINIEVRYSMKDEILTRNFIKYRWMEYYE